MMGSAKMSQGGMMNMTGQVSRMMPWMTSGSGTPSDQWRKGMPAVPEKNG